MFHSEKGAAFFSNEMILVKINAEVDTLIRDKYYAKAYPTSILMNKAGEEVDRVVGFDSTDAFLGTLVDFTNGIGTLDALLADAEGSDDRGLLAQIADKYKYRGSFPDAEEWYVKVIAAGDPHDSLSGEARMSQAYMLRKAEDYAGAIAAFRAIEEEFDTFHGRDALIWEAIVHRMNDDTATAVATFQSYIDKYPDEEDAEYAAEQIEELTNPPEESGE